MIIKEYQVNEQITDREVKVIKAEGQLIGILSSSEALRIAEQAGMDLVKIAPQAVPPICKLMNYDKFRFESIKKEKENKKNQKVIKLKEVQLSIVIDVGDLNVKAKRANEFLADGNKVRVVIRMRGRQNKRPELGIKILNDFFSQLTNAVLEQGPLQEGNTLRMQVAPAKASK